MAKFGRPRAEVVITASERTELRRLTKRAHVNRAVAFRARVVLACADNTTDKAVARHLRTTKTTVAKWRLRFNARRLAGLYDEPRVGAPRTVSDEAIEAVIVKTLETTPKGETHWSTRTMAKAAGMSHTMVGRIWRTFGLQPPVTESFKLSPDPQLVAKVRDVVGWICTRRTMRWCSRWTRNPGPGAPARAADPADGYRAARTPHPQRPPAWHARSFRRAERRHWGSPHTVHTAASRPGFRGVPPRHRRERRAGPEIHVVLDNLSAHKAPAVQRWLLRHPRVHFHFTPTYASWLNLVERFFGLLTAKALKRASHTSIPQLRAAILAYVEAHNERRTPFRWVKTTDEIRDKMRRFALRVQQVYGQ
jgi:transposase